MAKSSMSLEIKFDRLPQLRGELRRRASNIVRETAFAVEAQAKELAPVDTGTLRNSIQAEPEGEHTWIVAPHTEYAEHLEYGTRHMAAQPYMTPAAEAERPIFLSRMKDVLK